jgi:hypothetical protein
MAAIALIAFAGSIAAVVVSYQTNEKRDVIAFALRKELQCPEISIQTLSKKFTQPSSEIDVTELPAIVEALSTCTNLDSARPGVAYNYLSTFSRRAPLAIRWKALISSDHLTSEVASVVLGNLTVVTSTETQNVVSLLIDNFERLNKDTFPVLYKLILDGLWGRIHGEINVLRQALGSIRSAKTPSESITSAKVAVEHMKSLVLAQRIVGRQELSPDYNLAALDQMDDSLSTMKRFYEANPIEEFEHHQVIIQRRFPGGNSNEYFYQAAILDRPLEGAIVLKAPDANEFTQPGLQEAWINKGPPSTVDVVMESGQHKSVFMYHVYPRSDSSRMQNTMDKLVAAAEGLIRSISSLEPARPVPEPQVVAEAAMIVPAPEASIAPVEPEIPNSDLLKEARSEFKKITDNNSVAAMGYADKSKLVAALASPSSEEDWKSLIALDDAYAKPDFSCQEAFCIATNDILKTALREAEGILKKSAAQPPAGLTWPTKVLSQSEQ